MATAVRRRLGGYKRLPSGRATRGLLNSTMDANFSRKSNTEGIEWLQSHKGGVIMALAGHVPFVTKETFDNESLAAGTPRATGANQSTLLSWPPPRRAESRRPLGLRFDISPLPEKSCARGGTFL